jgi:hypothetical protein
MYATLKIDTTAEKLVFDIRRFDAEVRNDGLIWCWQLLTEIGPFLLKLPGSLQE